MNNPNSKNISVAINPTSTLEIRKKHPGGRPVIYDYNKILKPILPLIPALVANGMTQYKLAEHLGISDDVISDWKLKYPEFNEAIKKAKTCVMTRSKRPCITQLSSPKTL